MPNSQPAPAEEVIPQVSAGGPDTLLSAHRANRLIRAVNMLLRLRVGRGLKLHKADGNMLLELEVKDAEPKTPPTGSGGGASEPEEQTIKLCRNGTQITWPVYSPVDPTTLPEEP